MLKKYNPKFNVGSLFICSKCGQAFDEPKLAFAEKLKTDLRNDLKAIDAHTQVRVMVGGCLGVCQNNEQAFAYYPNQGAVELMTTSSDEASSKADIFDFIKLKV